jgi:hypothetical protein
MAGKGIARRRLVVAGAVMLVAGLSSAARADVSSDQAGAILVFPKVVVDTSPQTQAPGGPVDTLIRITNTSTRPISLHCFWVDANGHCSNAPATICAPFRFGATSNVCGSGGYCLPGWQETDFDLNVTARQPVAWLASQGSVLCQGGDTSDVPCLPLGPARPGPNGQDNTGSAVLQVPEDPFIGELECVAVDGNGVPVERNDLKGEAEIVHSKPDAIDVSAYNAIGIPSIPGTNNGDDTLVLGGTGAEYSSCPNILILDHFFDGASDPVTDQPITTVLTLVPCSQDFLRQAPVTTPVQFLVFNEFEQRFSTSRIVTCYDNIRISNIETLNPDRSLFSAAVAGTLTGQTRIRGVGDSGHTLLGVAEEFRAGGGSAAVNLHFTGTRPQSDFIYLPPN